MKKMFYEVPDAEHMGDVRSEKYRLQQMGATIVGTDIDWGDEEISQAIIRFEVPDDKVQDFLNYGCYYDIP